MGSQLKGKDAQLQEKDSQLTEAQAETEYWKNLALGMFGSSGKGSSSNISQEELDSNGDNCSSPKRKKTRMTKKKHPPR